MDFWTWTLLRACCQTLDCLLKKTSSSTSLPLGKQWRKIQFFFAKLSSTLFILNFLNWLNFFVLFTLSFMEITLSEKITSAPFTAFFGSFIIWILFLLLLIYLIIFLLGWYFNGHPILSLKENLIEAAIKEFKTLLESPTQAIFKLDIGFFLISSTVKISDKIWVGWELGLRPL